MRRERERERGRERGSERERDRDRDRETERDRERQRKIRRCRLGAVFTKRRRNRSSINVLPSMKKECCLAVNEKRKLSCRQ